MPKYDKDIDNMLVTTPRRICGLLTARGRSAEWEKAFVHISTHFRSDLSKPTHTCFQKKYCDQEAVKELIKRAAGAPSSVRPAKLTIGSMPVGRDCIIIVRDFAEPIGDTTDLTCLIIVADSQGNLITAYPGTKKDLSL